MAGAIGNVGAYGTDTPLQRNEIGDALTQVENIGFRNRQEQLQRDKLKKAEDDAKLAELDEYNKKFGVNITGNQSIDDTTTGYAMRTKQEVGDITRQIQQTNDFNKKSQLMALRAKKVQSFDILKQIPDMLIKQGDEIAKGVEAGKYDPESVNLIQDKFKSLEQGKVHYYTDDAGNLRFTTYRVNEKGEPTGVIDKDQTVAELLKSLNPDLKSNYRDVVAKFHNEYKPDSTTTVDANGRTIKDARVDMRVGSKDYINAQENAKAILSQPQERKAVAKIANLAVDDVDGLLNYATNDLLRGVKSEYENKQDPNIAISRAREARLSKADEVPIPKIQSVSVAPNEYHIDVDGDNTRIPKGTKEVSVNGYVDGDPKKAHDRINSFLIRKGQDGKITVIGKIQSIGQSSTSESQTQFTEEGQKQINKLMTDNKGDEQYTLQDAQKEVSKSNPTSVLKTSERVKENPIRYVNLGVNQNMLSKYLPDNVAPNTVIRQVLKKAGYDPDNLNSQPVNTSSKMVTVILPDGRSGMIPENQVSAFIKRNPNAKRK